MIQQAVFYFCSAALLLLCSGYTTMMHHPSRRSWTWRRPSSRGNGIVCNAAADDNNNKVNDETSTSSSESSLNDEAERYLAQARALRESLPAEEDTSKLAEPPSKPQMTPWNIPFADETIDGVDYRLYVDIGREEGTWMDPRWGASGRRIEFTLDVRFATEALANKTVQSRMVQDNFGGKSSSTYIVQSAENARLRNGFDRMKCHGGAYRIDAGKNAATTRFYIAVNGIGGDSSTYDDISIPEGCLYFSLPVFGNISQLSSKEGIVSVRQMGWHTGWRREESRIVGTFRAVPIEKAKRLDGF